jgi:hypothetical protein
VAVSKSNFPWQMLSADAEMPTVGEGKIKTVLAAAAEETQPRESVPVTE